MRIISLYIGGGLTALIGLACAVGAFALRSGPPDNWPDVVGNSAVVRRVAIGLALAAVLLLGSSVGVFLRTPWGFPAALTALLVFVVGGFWGNNVVFGDMRPMHTITNVVVAVIALALIWFGLQES